MSTSTAKKSEWFRDKCEHGCQICGFKLSKLDTKNRGLELAHIVSEKDGGSNEKINCLALCPNCAYSFGVVLKPAIYAAFQELQIDNVPESWKDGEGRV